jgi:hypothetical protein
MQCNAIFFREIVIFFGRQNIQSIDPRFLFEKRNVFCMAERTGG